MKSTPRARTLVVVRVLVCGFLIIGLSGPLAQDSLAALFTLIDENSAVDFDTSSQDNAYNWRVDGVDHLHQQAFWYRVGNFGPETSLHALPHPVEGITDTNFDGDPDTLFVRYLGAGFRTEVAYRLDGGAPGSFVSDLTEQISITNTGTGPLDFHFFQYCDFDLGGTSGGDSAVFTNANAVQQFEGAQVLTETVVTPVPDHREINFFAATLTALNDGVATTLNDLPPTGVVLGPGDVTWAYQWDVVIGPGLSFQISKDKNLVAVPEPTTLSLAGLAVVAAASLRMRRRAG